MAAPPSRTLFAVVWTAILVTAPTVSAASLDGSPQKPRRVIAKSRSAGDLGLRPAFSLTPPDLSLRPPAQPGGAFQSKGFSAGGLVMAGLKSPFPPASDGGAQCRTGCAERRIVCDAQDSSPDCTPRWSICVSACNSR